MGVPKFTRFICERYPCLLEVLNEYQIPEFDNLYLDMNGIIHCCSHPNDADAHFRITEETIFKNIFLYVEILFRKIKPQKLFFMAVDGVAPRAKINQQRSRRFRSAKEAELVEARARAKGEKLPEEARFDSNCITPGTEFMAKLTEQLRYFVIYKISTDKLWQRCKVILSGPEVPGEGEHKIMDYIRYMKAQPDHDPNTRHCLYGLDADLVMLSLCTHEPHFAVLREEVKYGRNPQKTTSQPEKTKFCLLHVSLLREYMEHEFEGLKDKLSFPFDLEKLIDDWILMSFLIGNDFIPHLPNLHIASGALPILYQVYMETLPTLDGYINEAGTLNLARFEKFMAKLSALDVNHFSEHQADLKYFEAKTGRRPDENERTSYRNSKQAEDSPLRNPVKKGFKKDLENLIQSTEDMLLGHSDEEGELLDSDSDTETYALEFLQHKQEYYKTKLDLPEVDDEAMRQQAEAYVTAIQWNLHYYYDGCCSWSWYYPHHYAPFISDIKDFKDLKLTFDMATPFLPFQQLLATLPAVSKGLLPEAYHKLLTDEDSPIIDYYPDDFKTDLNEKKQEWEAVVLIPFINEKRLIDAMKPYNVQLTPEEQKRNHHGPMSIIEYSPEALGITTPPAYFPTIANHARITLIEPRDIDVPRECLNKGLMKGAKLSVYFPGFHTFQHLDHKVKLEKGKVNVFEQPSRGDNMMIIVAPKPAPELSQMATDLLGNIVFIRWPHLLEAHVIGVSNGARRIYLIDPEKPYSEENVAQEEFNGPNEIQWRGEARDVDMGYRTRFGIIVGDIEALVHVRPITGRRYILTSMGRMSLQKEWSNLPSYCPYHTIVRDIEVEATGNVAHKNISDMYVLKSVCFMLANPHYGAMGEVIDPGVNVKTGRVKVAMNATPEPDLSLLNEAQARYDMQYMHASIASQRLGISSHLLSRITGAILVTPRGGGDKKENLGLNLKFNKHNKELPGYTRKDNGKWTYSPKTVALIRDYIERYPTLLERLMENLDNKVFDEDELFQEGESLTDVVKWLAEQPFRSVENQNCNYRGLDPDVISQMETVIDEFVAKHGDSGKTVIMQVKAHLLFKAGTNDGNIPPDLKANHAVYDRIISVQENSNIPLGYKGTIINIKGTPGAMDTVYDVFFDKPFIGGISFTGGANCRRAELHVGEFINISYGMRIAPAVTKTSEKPLKKRQDNSYYGGTSAFASFTPSHYPHSVPGLGKEKPVQSIQGHGTKQGQLPIQDPMKGRTNPLEETFEKLRNKEKQAPVPIKNAPTLVKTEPTEQVEHKPQKIEPEVKTPGANSEFLMLWNELQKIPNNPKPKIPPATQIKPNLPPVQHSENPQDLSAFLKAVLKIPDDTTSEKSVPKPSLPFTFPAAPANPNNSSNAPPLVQQMFDHARQTRKEISYCAKLLNYHQLLGNGMPRYFYSSQKGLVHAQIFLPDMRRFYGDLCSNHELAAESAAKKVCSELNLDNAPKPRMYFDLLPPNAWLQQGMNQGINPGVNQGINQGVNQGINPGVNQGLNPGVNQGMNQGVNQGMNQGVNHGINQGMNQTAVNVQPPVMRSPRSFPDSQKPPVRPPANWNPRMNQASGFTQMAPPRMHVPMMSPSTSQNDNKEVKQAAPFVPLQAQKKTRSQHNNKKDSDAGYQKKPLPVRIKAKDNSPKITRDEKAKENEGKKEAPFVQQNHSNPRQRRSRIAANFGGASNGNGK